jgi:hypothetical protein
LPYAFEAQSTGNHVDFVKTRIVKLQESALLTDLRRFVNCLNVDTDAQRIVWVVGEVAVEVSSALFHARATAPEIHELRQLLEIHERDVVKVAENLPFKYHRLGDAALTTALGVWRMELAVVVDFVSLILRESTILAFHVTRVLLGTLLFHIGKEAIERIVLTVGHQSSL